MIMSCPLVTHFSQFRESTPSSQCWFKVEVVGQYAGQGKKVGTGIWCRSVFPQWCLLSYLQFSLCSRDLQVVPCHLLSPETRFLQQSSMSSGDMDSLASILACPQIWWWVSGELWSQVQGNWKTPPCSFNYFLKSWSPTPPLLWCD